MRDIWEKERKGGMRAGLVGRKLKEQKGKH